MMTLEDKQTFTDISIIIRMMPKYMQNKINKKFIDFIEENKDINYVSNIKTNIPLKNQVLNPNTKNMLGLIYRDYLCSTSQREALIRQEQENINKYEISFKKTLNSNLQNPPLVEIPKENFIKKLLKFIKNVFNKF